MKKINPADRLDVQHYVACALWASTDFDSGEPLDQDHTLESVAPEALDQIASDLDDFYLLAGNLIAGLTVEQTAQDLFLTRNGHGCGFWDRGLGAVGDQLTKLAKSLGSSDPYVGDDQRVYLA